MILTVELVKAFRRGIIAIVSLVSITWLLLYGAAIPDEAWPVFTLAVGGPVVVEGVRRLKA